MITKRISRPYKPDWKEKALRIMAIAVQGQAVLLAPIDTGRLRGSITYTTEHRTSRTKDPAKSADGVKSKEKDTAIIGSNVKYAPHVEYGASGTKQVGFVITGGMPARPYLRPAIDENKANFKKIIQRYWKRQSFGKSY